MHRRLPARALLMILPLALVGCGDIGLDNLGEFVVTYNVAVTSDSRETVLVSISTPDVERRASVTFGLVAARSFKPGVVTVRASGPGGWMSEAEARSRAIEAGLQSGPLDAAGATALRDELLTLHQGRDETGPWVSCTWEVKPGPAEDGENDLVYVVDTAADGSAFIRGPGC